MKLITIAKCALLGVALSVMPLQAQNHVTDSTKSTKFFSLSRLTVGGYGEAVYTRNFYSDNMFRYSHAERYRDAKGHGRVDIPHVVINLGYDFGKGWTMGTEIEFEHGGNEVAVELEAEETGEFEHEIERGGEVALEQFWIQKSFGKAINIRPRSSSLATVPRASSPSYPAPGMRRASVCGASSATGVTRLFWCPP